MRISQLGERQAVPSKSTTDKIRECVRIMAANLTDLRARSGYPKGLAPQLDPRSQTLGNRLAATTKLLELGLKPDVDKKIAYLPTEGRRTIADVAA